MSSSNMASILSRGEMSEEHLVRPLVYVCITILFVSIVGNPLIVFLSVVYTIQCLQLFSERSVSAIVWTPLYCLDGND